MAGWLADRLVVFPLSIGASTAENDKLLLILRLNAESRPQPFNPIVNPPEADLTVDNESPRGRKAR